MAKESQDRSKKQKTKKKFAFPTAFTVLFIILVIAAFLTYVVPAGLYSNLEYISEDSSFLITNPDGEAETVPATQGELDKLGIQINLEKFEDESIKKPIAIPDSYQEIEQNPQGPLDIIMAPVEGVMDTVDIMVFVLIIGGIIGIINKSGAFDAGIAALSRKTKGKEFLLVIFVSALIALGGTTFGLAEETIALYPILMPIFLASGYDAIVAIAAIYLGSSVGTMFSTVNPFSVVIASDAAGISFTEGLGFRFVSLILAMVITLVYIYWYSKKIKKNPEKSLVYEDQERIEKRFLQDYHPDDVKPFNWRRVGMLVVFLGAFPIMIWGVVTGKFWFSEMSSLFLTVVFIIAFLSGFSEKKVVNTFLDGAADLIGVALIIGVARSINIVMDNGMISDTLLYYTSSVIDGMSGGLFAGVQMILFSFLGFFVPSSSGLAVLSMPIMAPLADTVNISRDIVVTAYNWGQGWMAFITPTGLILATLEMVDVTYDKWLKFVLPLMGAIGVFSVIMLVIQAII